ncbi:MAG TPA: hypothetical protein DCE00_02670 [Firmicutes bacterium]|nr:queuosine precursor transporter [Bacillota bacterium]HAA37758.1 hypothetical protein [Bacillota bacterium]
MNKREVMAVAFIVTLLTSNILATKLTVLGPFILPAAVVVYPFCFMCGDILTEVWGFKYAKKVILAGFAANIFLTLLIYIGQILPAAPTWPHQEAYITIFAPVPRIVLGSLVAYLFGELTNSFALERIKDMTGPGLLFVRTIGSSIVGQFFDTVIFIGIAFLGTIPLNVLFQIMLGQYLIKIALETLGGTPLAYLLINWSKEDNCLENGAVSRGSTS